MYHSPVIRNYEMVINWGIEFLLIYALFYPFSSNSTAKAAEEKRKQEELGKE